MSHPNDASNCAQVDMDTDACETRPTIWGGQFEANWLTEFLEAWNLAVRDMPWRVWEWISDLKMDHVAPGIAGLPGNPHLLERGRLFGTDGDLSLRRDGERFLWNFVGRRDTTLPQRLHWEGPVKESSAEKDVGSRFAVADYWAYHPQAFLSGRRRVVLLWGKERYHNGNPMGTWHDDRVSNVKHPLVYPTMSGKNRVRLSYCEYMRGDVIEAVWWLRLEGWGVNDG